MELLNPCFHGWLHLAKRVFLRHQTQREGCYRLADGARKPLLQLLKKQNTWIQGVLRDYSLNLED